MKKILPLLIISIFVSCKKDATTQNGYKQGVWYNVSSHSSILFDSVWDSRCPPNALCLDYLSPGYVIGKFKFVENSDTTQFKLTNVDSIGGIKNEILVSHYQIKLIDVSPIGPVTKQGDYKSATVSITKQ